MEIVRGKGYIPKWFIPTPSLLVNNKLEHGGIPSGVITHVIGSGEGSFKSTFALQTLGNAQKMGIDCAYIDAEGAVAFEEEETENGVILRNKWFENLGVDPNKLYYIGPDTGEVIWETVEKLIEEHNVKFIIMDSIHAVQPTKIHETEFGDAVMMAHAKLHTVGLVRLIPILRKNDATIMGINHLRVNMTAMGAMGENPSGGKAWKFYNNLTIQLTRTNAKSKLEGEDVIPINVYIQKSKLGSSWIDINTYAEQGFGFQEKYELLDVAIEKGILDLAKGWYVFPDKTKGRFDKATDWVQANKQLILEA